MKLFRITHAMFKSVHIRISVLLYSTVQSQDKSDSIVTRLQAGQPNCCSSFWKEQEIVLFPKNPDWFRGPPCFLLNANQGVKNQGINTTTHLLTGYQCM